MVQESQSGLTGQRPLPDATDESSGERPNSETSTGVTVGEISEFLYQEARLLDERLWEQWLALWTPDATYSMPTRRTQEPTSESRGVDDELTPPGGAWWFDDSMTSLETRVIKLRTGKAWAEEPPSRTRRFVTNVELLGIDHDDGVLVRSNLLLYRGRRDSDVEWFSCARRDSISRAADGLRLSARSVIIDSNVVLADNLVLFL